jgi:hypothetical protein
MWWDAVDRIHPTRNWAPLAGCLERGTYSSVSLKGKKFLD